MNVGVEVRITDVDSFIGYFDTFHIGLYESSPAEVQGSIIEMFLHMLVKIHYGQIKAIHGPAPAPRLPRCLDLLLCKEREILVVSLQCNENRNVTSYFSQRLFFYR